MLKPCFMSTQYYGPGNVWACHENQSTEQKGYGLSFSVKVSMLPGPLTKPSAQKHRGWTRSDHLHDVHGVCSVGLMFTYTINNERKPFFIGIDSCSFVILMLECSSYLECLVLQSNNFSHRTDKGRIWTETSSELVLTDNWLNFKMQLNQ